ncbi:MAG TPA: alpha/beta fold hydrolase [Candidatus Acidoferrales bacterium]|nr:alpha/beta fold hydrolase [Candidatus Acidoferrales bacterium]
MAVLSELRYPTTRFAKALSGLLAIILFAIVAVGTISGFLLYQILKPPRSPAMFDLNVMMGHPTMFSFTPPGGTQQDGWFFPGLRGAPTIIVSHGYLSQRGDVLTLAAALQQHEFNAFVFDYAGHGSSAGPTSLGYREAAELQAAVQALSGRDDVDPQHFGLWGIDMGAYASLAVASADKRVGALAVDNVYDSPYDLLQIEVKNSGLSALPFVTGFCKFGFQMLNYQYREQLPLSVRLGATRGIPKLFIQTDDKPVLARDTATMFAKAPDPKQLAEQSVSYRDMSDEDRRNYENEIANFFAQYLPLQSR